MKKQITLLLILIYPILAHAQLDISLGYSFGKDDFLENRAIPNIGIGYTYTLNDLIAIRGSIDVEYMFKYRTKGPYYDNYQANDLDPLSLEFIKQEFFLVRKNKNNSLFITPSFNVMGKLGKKGILSNIVVYSGIETRIIFYDWHKWSYVRYNENLEVVRLYDDEVSNPVPRFYNYYVPIGIQYKWLKPQIFFDFSYSFSLNRSSLVLPWRILDKYNNIKIKVGYFF